MSVQQNPASHQLLSGPRGHQCLGDRIVNQNGLQDVIMASVMWSIIHLSNSGLDCVSKGFWGERITHDCPKRIIG